MKMNENYRLVMTGDGTYTLLDTVLNETMHTMSGAYEESLVKHVKASRILEKESNDLNILDVGFGLGYNSLAVLSSLREIKPDCRIKIVSLEKDTSFGEWIDQISFKDGRREFYDKVKKAYLHGDYSDGVISIRVEFGDARSHIIDLVRRNELFDAVFQDAYSPGKNPELWSIDYFQLIRRLMSPDSILTTYSAAPQIRRALLEAGFSVGRADSTGKKKEGTVAALKVADNELSDIEKNELMSNIKSTVYRDENLDDARDVILTRRIKEMERIRESRRVRQE